MPPLDPEEGYPLYTRADTISRRRPESTTPRQTRTPEQEANYVTFLRGLFSAAQKAKRGRWELWARNYKIVNNRFQSAVFQNWSPQPRDSEVYPILSSLVAWLTDQEPDIGFMPAANPNSDFYDMINKIADDLTSVFATNWVVEEYDRQYKKMLWDGLMYGTGIIKSIWDNAAAENMGNAVVCRVDPYSFYPDPGASCLDDAEYVIEARRMSYDQIARRYPDTAFLLTTGGSERPPDLKPDIWGVGSTTSTVPGVTDGSYGFLPSGNGVWGRSQRRGSTENPSQTFTVYEYWLRENTYEDLDANVQVENDIYPPPYAIPKWKCVVTCNGHILFEEWAEDLWLHGSHPYDDWRFDDIGEFWGISLVDHLALPQLYINRLLTALQQNSELVGNPIFLEPSNSGTNRSNVINRPGTRLTVNASGGAAAANLPRWLQPPSMPPQVMELINFWIARIENTAGINGMQKGQDPKQRQSNNTVQNIQESAFVRIRSALTNLQWTYRRSAWKCANLIVQNYTDTRIMAVIGPDGEATSLYLSPYHFYDPATSGEEPLKFIIRAEAGANQATSRQARISSADTLFAMGVVDDQYVLAVHGVRDAKKILERKYNKQQAGFGGGGKQRKSTPGGPGQ
jgi:hypothetical protein